jgi:hypothetical protein
MQIQPSPKREIVEEIYRAMVLLGADNGLLGTIGSWGNALPDEDVLANLRGWNQTTLKETTTRIQHYEMTFPRPACIPDEGRQTAPPAR